MPYVTKDRRQELDYRFFSDKEKIEGGLEHLTKGDLEYIVFKIMKLYMSKKEYRYSTLHDVVYAVQHCADEFRRRYLDKREDEARETNGDI